MGHFPTSFSESFLLFAGMSCLQLTDGGKLKSVLPANRDFWGWNGHNLHLFDLTEHLLKPNNLVHADLFGNLPQQPKMLCWKGPLGRISRYLPCVWERMEGDDATLRVLISGAGQGLSLEAGQSRKFFFQALNLPGFLHNVNGPLGTIFGRTELLRFKYPDIPDFDEIIRVGYRLQSILNNFSYKVNQEKYSREVKINLNRFLSEEITFLDSDLFFKHHVKKVEEFRQNIPEFYTCYWALSGVLAEAFRFLRQFVDGEKDYLFLTRSFRSGDDVGFEIEFRGELEAQGDLGDSLPFRYEGDYRTVGNHFPAAMDLQYFSQCMIAHQGIISLQGDSTAVQMHYQFPLPHEVLAEEAAEVGFNSELRL